MRVLVVEDDADIRDLLRSGLTSERFFVDTAKTGTEGWQLASTNSYDIIILDYMLPERDGLEVCTQLRADGVATHIIGLSARAEAQTRIRLLDAGADDYLTKPFSFQELLARMRAVSRRPNKIAPEVLAAYDIELDSKRHTVKKNGENIYLTRKEFALLEYLMENRGTALSRATILEHVWDMNADPFSNTIETHIMTLRRKIDTDKKDRIIQTIPGIGYKIE